MNASAIVANLQSLDAMHRLQQMPLDPTTYLRNYRINPSPSIADQSLNLHLQHSNAVNTPSAAKGRRQSEQYNFDGKIKISKPPVDNISTKKIRPAVLIKERFEEQP